MAQRPAKMTAAVKRPAIRPMKVSQATPAKKTSTATAKTKKA